MAAEAPPVPPLKLLTRGPDGATLYVGDGRAMAPSGGVRGVPCGAAVWSADGALLALTQPEGVAVYDAHSERLVGTVPAPQCVAVAFSPGGTYLVCFQKPAAAERNLGAWDARTGEQVFGCASKAYSKSTWPSLMFSGDDSVMVRQVTNEVHVHSARDWSTPAARLRVPGVAAASLAPGPGGMVAVFVAEAKGQPASVRLHPLPDKPGEVVETPAVARKSFFRVNEVRFAWSATGEAVLVRASADVDVSNQSYNGESSLYFLRADGSVDCQVPLEKEGNVHAVEWSPSGKSFVVVYGQMPARATCFDLKCKPTYELGSGAYNMAVWSPHGRFLALAGFGNLPGDVGTFDRKADGKLKPMGGMRARDQVDLQWSACGRYVMTCTTAPRLNVDNGFKVFTYRGEQVCDVRLKQLFQASWRPAPPGVYPDRPQTPRAAGEKPPEVAGPPKPAPFRPKHLQGVETTAKFSLAKDADDKGPGRPGAYRPPSAQAAAAGPPGAEGAAESKAAAKNRKKREAAARKKAAEAAGGA